MDISMNNAPSQSMINNVVNNAANNAQKPITTIDDITFGTKLKNPILMTDMKLISESAQKSYNNMYHTFVLPINGDYSHNFKISSDYIYKGYQAPNMLVDCISNYIESISLTLSNNSSVISKIENIQKTYLLSPQNGTEKIVIPLEFTNLPLLTKCQYNSNFQIIIKFTKSPPINYQLVYDTMYVDDSAYADRLCKEFFTVVYKTHIGNTKKTIGMEFNLGNISIKDV
jgi:hypothetical protein